jgi:hypothetical protein
MAERWTERREAQYYLERLLRDLGLTVGDHPLALALKRQAELFTTDSATSRGLSAGDFYAIASLVERAVCRALNANPTRTAGEIQAAVREQVESYGRGPSEAELAG